MPSIIFLIDETICLPRCYILCCTIYSFQEGDQDEKHFNLKNNGLVMFGFIDGRPLGLCGRSQTPSDAGGQS